MGSMRMLPAMSRGVLLWTLLAESAGLAWVFATPCVAGDVAREVELSCSIKAPSREREVQIWQVELRRASGEPARVLTAMSGETLHIRNLDPGIYTVCILGSMERRHCESVDLNPPPGKTTYRFLKKFQAPTSVLDQADLHQVNLHQLAIPQDARRQFLSAEQADMRGDVNESITHLKRAIEIDPSYADAVNNLGSHYHRNGQYDLAIQCFKKVTELNPEFYGGWVNLAASLLSKGKFRDALEANQRAYRLRPDEPLVSAQLGLNYYYMHDLSEAKKYFLKTLQRDPASALSPQLYLAHIALAEMHQKEAVEYFTEYLKIHPNTPEAENLRLILSNLVTNRIQMAPETGNIGP